MEEKVLFRNKGRGYNKDDVNEYITAENKRFSEAEFALKKTIAEKDKAISGFTDELFRKNNELTELKNTVIQKDRTIGELRAAVEESENTRKELSAKVETLEAELKQRELRIKELMEQPPQIVEVEKAPTEAPVAVQPETTVVEAPLQTTEPEQPTVVEEVAEPIAEPADEPVSPAADSADDSDSLENYSAEPLKNIKGHIDDLLSYARKEAFNILNVAMETSKKISVPKSEFDSIKRDISGRSASIISEIRRAPRMKRR